MTERNVDLYHTTSYLSPRRIGGGNATRKALYATALWLGALQAQAQDSASATVVAEIAPAAISLQNTGGLHFGRILPFGRRGNVTVHANGYTVATNAYMLDASAARAASWIVNGTPGAAYRVVLPTTLSVDNGNASMTLSWIFRSGPSALTLDGSGTGAFTVGAVLDVGANQAPGTYLGVLPVTVAYE